MIFFLLNIKKFLRKNFKKNFPVTNNISLCGIIVEAEFCPSPNFDNRPKNVKIEVFGIE